MLDRLRIDPECPDWERNFFRKLHRRSFSHRKDRAEKCWNGTLNPRDLRSLLGESGQISLPFAKFQQFRKRFINFTSPLSDMAYQMEHAQQQARGRAALATLPNTVRRLSALIRRPSRPLLHPAFRPTTSAPNTQRRRRPQQLPSILEIPPSTRILTQTRLLLTTTRHNTLTGPTTTLSTLSHHEHLTQMYSKLYTCNSGKAFQHLESTEYSSPPILHYHESPD
jgi:hypothetical protein